MLYPVKNKKLTYANDVDTEVVNFSGALYPPNDVVGRSLDVLVRPPGVTKPAWERPRQGG